MPTEPKKSLRDALYPDDLTDLERIEVREWAFYHARDEEDEESLPDDANEGWWLPINLGGDARWIAAPEALRQRLVAKGAGEGTVFQVLSCKRTGSEKHAPYEVSIEVLDDD